MRKQIYKQSGGWVWRVLNSIDVIIAGGMCRTKRDAINDASIWVATHTVAKKPEAISVDVVIVVRGGCVAGVLTNGQNIRAEVIDCDGDNKDMQEKRVRSANKNMTAIY